MTTRHARTAAAGLVAALVLTAAPAHAARDWTTVLRMDGAKLQACKVPVADGEARRVVLRLDARNAGRAAEAETQAVKGNRVTRRSWASGRVRSGKVSAVGSIRVPIGPRWTIDYYLGSSQGGTGTGGSTAGELSRC